MDASNLLKPMLARGELHTIGATTLDEYRKHIEKDAALERRFQPVFVDQPTVEETISILRGLRERYEVHHGVRITDSALVAAATLSNRYITERFLPDKAIDLVDEAASAGCAWRSTRCPSSSTSSSAAGSSSRSSARRCARRRTTRRRRASRRSRRSSPTSASRPARMKQRWEAEKARHRGHPRDEDGARAAPGRGSSRPSARPTTAPPPSCKYGDARRAPGAARRSRRRRSPRSRAPGSLLKEEVTPTTSPSIVARLDRHPGHPPDGGRAGEAHPHGGAPPRAGRRPGRGDRGRVRRRPARPRRAQGPAPADRLVPVPRPDRRRQDRARPGARASSCSTTSTR